MASEPASEPTESWRCQYDECLGLLQATGLACAQPGAGSVAGSAPYPAPTWPQMQALLAHNDALVEAKRAQGFTRLLLTPLALPIAHLLARVEAVIRQQAADGPIWHALTAQATPDEPARINTRTPTWVWELIRAPLDSPALRYFPTSYADRAAGRAKAEVLRDPAVCAVPGWSVGLIEPAAHLARDGEGAAVGGRAPLALGGAPRDYLAALAAPEYAGESGWTPEDFLTHFATQLAATGRLCHEREQGDATWLLGAWLPEVMPRALLVPLGYWTRAGGRLHLSTHRTANRIKALGGVRTVVRLERARPVPGGPCPRA